jgi:hypothetical protein
MEEKHNNTNWENRKEYDKVYLEFLNWAFIRKKIPPSSINIACSAVSKFICAFITDFNFAQSKFVKNIKKGFMMGNPKKPKYPIMWNPDLLIDYYYKNNDSNLSLKEKYQFLQTKVAILFNIYICYDHKKLGPVK